MCDHFHLPPFNFSCDGSVGFTCAKHPLTTLVKGVCPKCYRKEFYERIMSGDKIRTFENTFTSLFDAIKENQIQYEVYGIKFKSHSFLTKRDIIERTEDLRAFLFFNDAFKLPCIVLN